MCWVYENEYRLIVTNNDKDGSGNLKSSHHISIKDIKAKAIYIGEKCSKGNEEEIKQIAREKGIKVYKMKPNYLKQKYGLDFEEI